MQSESATLSVEAKKVKGRYQKRYPVTLNVGEEVLFKVKSTDFTPELTVYRDGVEVLSAVGMDEGLSNEAIYRLAISEGGAFEVMITSVGKGEDGGFFLDIYRSSPELVKLGQADDATSQLLFLCANWRGQFESLKQELLDSDPLTDNAKWTARNMPQEDRIMQRRFKADYVKFWSFETYSEATEQFKQYALALKNIFPNSTFATKPSGEGLVISGPPASPLRGFIFLTLSGEEEAPKMTLRLHSK